MLIIQIFYQFQQFLWSPLTKFLNTFRVFDFLESTGFKCYFVIQNPHLTFYYLSPGFLQIFQLSHYPASVLYDLVIIKNKTYPNIKEQVALNKSSLLLKIQIQNTQTLQLVTTLIETESIDKSDSESQAEGLGSETKWSN